MLGIERLREIANYILKKTHYRPIIGVICGSGLGGLADMVEKKFIIPYADVPDFPKSTVQGHAGNLVFGELGGKVVLLMQGRFHPYEGYTTQTCTIPVRVMHLLGIKILMLTNAAGGLNQSYNVGDMMIIKDHINLPGLCGLSPLVGHNEPSLGDRFIPLSDAYDRELRELARKVVHEVGECDRVHEGVYAMQLGPAYETVAECRFMRMVGGDTVGMSTTHEVVVARHMQMRVFGMSLVTNMCVLEYDSAERACHEEVLAVGRDRARVMQKVITELIRTIKI